MNQIEEQLSFDEVAELLDDIVDNDFAYVYYRGLNGGIYLVPEEKHNEQIPSNHYYVVGEYQRNPYLGRSIYIYYGSFIKTHPFVSKEKARMLLKEIIAHELQHHLESLAGVRDLEKEDERYVQQALRYLGVSKSDSPHQEG